MIVPGRAPRRVSAGLIALFLVTAACGGDDDAGPTLTPDAAAGREIARTNGCAACHGSDGEGGVGPPLAGLYGATVTLTDGTTVTADDGYLAESIRTPDAARVDGYELSMPDNDLSDDEIAAVIAFIRGLSQGASTP